jgi:hypothetical protein
MVTYRDCRGRVTVVNVQETEIEIRDTKIVKAEKHASAPSRVVGLGFRNVVFLKDQDVALVVAILVRRSDLAATTFAAHTTADGVETLH